MDQFTSKMVYDPKIEISKIKLDEFSSKMVWLMTRVANPLVETTNFSDLVV